MDESIVHYYISLVYLFYFVANNFENLVKLVSCISIVVPGAVTLGLRRLRQLSASSVKQNLVYQ